MALTRKPRTVRIKIYKDLAGEDSGSRFVLSGLVQVLGITKPGKYRVRIARFARGTFLVLDASDGRAGWMWSNGRYVRVLRVGTRQIEDAVVCASVADRLGLVPGVRYSAIVTRVRK